MVDAFTGLCCSASGDVITSLIGDEGGVLYHPDTRKEKMVNPTGLFIWSRMDGSRGVEDIAAELGEHFESVPSEEVVDDVRKFVEDLESHGFAAQSPPETAPRSGWPDTFPHVGDGPRSVDLSLTGKCNLRCAYCFYHDEMQSRPDLPKEQWLTFFEELKSLGVRDAVLSGGEIFTRPDLWELIDGLIENRLRYSINTNGTLIREETLRAFEVTRRFGRLSSIQVSIDGSCAEVHDKSRGRGSFEKAARGLRLLKEAGFPVTVRVTVNRHNVDDLENVASLLLDDIGLASFGTNDAMPMGAGCENQAAITLTPEQQLKAMKTLAGLAEKYNGRVTAMAGPLAKWRTYREMEHARATGEKSTRWQMGYLTACGGVFSKLSVNHDGTIIPCNMLAKLVLGGINRDSLTHIWKENPTLKALKDRQNIPMTEVPGCEDCEWASFCNGSCPGLAYDMTGDFNLANPHDCYRRFVMETRYELRLS